MQGKKQKTSKGKKATEDKDSIAEIRKKIKQQKNALMKIIRNIQKET